MAQLIYSILALLMIMFLSMNMQRNIGKDQQSQTFNEVTTQLTGVGTEVLERIGSTHFDRYALLYRFDESRYCGRVEYGQEAEFTTDPALPCPSFPILRTLSSIPPVTTSTASTAWLPSPSSEEISSMR